MLELQKVYTEIGLRIRMLRKERGITQLDLAKRCGMEPSNLNRIERGHTNPTLRTLYLIADELGISLGSLMKNL